DRIPGIRTGIGRIHRAWIALAARVGVAGRRDDDRVVHIRRVLHRRSQRTVDEALGYRPAGDLGDIDDGGAEVHCPSDGRGEGPYVAVSGGVACGLVVRSGAVGEMATGLADGDDLDI